MYRKNRLHILGFVLLLLFLYGGYTAYEYGRLYYCSKSLVLPESLELLRIKLYGSSQTPDGNTVSATFSIIDSNSNEIAVVERSWAGSYLAVEFDVLNMAGKHFIFPGRIYGKNHIFENRLNKKKITSLERYYNENRQCMLLGYGSNYRQRHQLYSISTFVTETLHVPVIDFGYTSKYIVDLSNCKTDKYYSIARDINGRVILQEL